ncbi:MAG: hypothetical protein V5A72_01805 [Candidatus Nanohaloarchaea archaeon]
MVDAESLASRVLDSTEKGDVSEVIAVLTNLEEEWLNVDKTKVLAYAQQWAGDNEYDGIVEYCDDIARQQNKPWDHQRKALAKTATVTMAGVLGGSWAQKVFDIPPDATTIGVASGFFSPLAYAYYSNNLGETYNGVDELVELKEVYDGEIENYLASPELLRLEKRLSVEESYSNQTNYAFS